MQTTLPLPIKLRRGFCAGLLLLIGLASLGSCTNADDPSCNSSMTFINKTPETLQISVNGSIPSGCGFVGPDERCKAVVSPNVTFTYTALGSKKTKWEGSDAVPKCTNVNLSLSY